MNDIHAGSARYSVPLKSASILIGVITAVGLYAPPASAEALSSGAEEDDHSDTSLQTLFELNENSLYKSSEYSEEAYSEQYQKQESQSVNYEKEKAIDCYCEKQQKEVKVAAAEVSKPPAAAPAQPKPAVPPEVLGASTTLVASGPVAAGQNFTPRTNQLQIFVTGMILLTVSIALFIRSALLHHSSQYN